MTTENHLREIRDIFTHLAMRSRLDNLNGYSDLNKYAELLFKAILGHIYDKEFKQFTKVNYPAIDLYSIDNEIAIQVSSDDSTTKVTETLKKFIDNKFDKTYKTLYILFLKDKSSIRGKSIQNILVDTTFSEILIKSSIFGPENLLDFNQLYKLIEQLSSGDIANIHKHLEYEFPQRVSRQETILKDIPRHPKPTNYIDRHLTKNDQNDYWAQFFDKKTLLNIVKDCITDQKTIKLIIRASAGHGKSIELDNLSHELQELKADIIPLKVSIKNYTNDLNAFIALQYSFWEEINKSQILLLIDGLDELSSTTQQNFIADFNHLLNSIPKINVICTIRSNFDTKLFSAENNSFEEYFIHPLFEKDVEDYINRYSIKSKELKKLIKKSWAKSIILIPFYLIELVELSNDIDQKLPSNLQDFYSLIIHRRINNDYYKYNGTIDREDLLQTIKKTAIYMTLQGLNAVKLSKVASLSTLSKEDYRKIPFFSIYEEGLETHLSFLHNNFQEFLAAEWLSTLNWEAISAIVFNDKTNYLNTKLLNTTVILFSILDKQSGVYTLLMNKIKETDYTILFYLEKDRLPIHERLQIFKQYIREGKEKGLAYLFGDFRDQDLLNFIDYETNGLEFIIAELKEHSNSSNHFRSLLYLIWAYPKQKLTKRKTEEIFSFVQKLILVEGFEETEYDLLLKIVDHLEKFDLEFVNNFVKSCPMISYRYVFTTFIEIVKNRDIPDQFEYIISMSEDVNRNGSNLLMNHERTFSKYVIHNLDTTNYKYLLNQLSADNNAFLLGLLDGFEYFDDDNYSYIDHIYIKLAKLANETNISEVTNDFIKYLNKIKYGSYSKSSYGNVLLFFNNLGKEDLFRLLLTNDTILASGYIFNKLFDMEKADISQEIIGLYQQGTISDAKLKLFYEATLSFDSITSVNLSIFMSSEFPDDFVVLTPLSTLQNRRDEWKKNGLKSLSNREEYIKKIQQVIDYIKDHSPAFVNEEGILDFDFLYHRQLDQKFENSILIDFVDHQSLDNNIETITTILNDDNRWYSYLEGQIRQQHTDEDKQHLIEPLKMSLQKYVDSIVSTIDYPSCRDKELNRDTLEIQIAIWFKKGTIDLPFETAIQLLCHDAIDKHTLDRVRMNDFLIEKYTLETIQPYLIQIIEDQSSSIKDIALSIRTCTDHEIRLAAEEVYEILSADNNRLHPICAEYLIRIGEQHNKLIQYLIDHPTLSEDWQINILDYVINEDSHELDLLNIIENQISFEPNPNIYNHIPISLCKYGLQLGSQKCMLIFFKYLKSKRSVGEILYKYFQKVEKSFPDELFDLCLETLDIYKDKIEDHGRTDILGSLDAIITNLASSDINKYQQTIEFYDRLMNDNGDTLSNIQSLEWWKIRLTKKFQERNSRYLTETETLHIIEA